MDGQLTISTDIFEITLIADVTAVRFTPIDLTIAEGIRDRALCYGVDWTRDVLDVSFYIETKVYECSTGLAGWLETE